MQNALRSLLRSVAVASAVLVASVFTAQAAHAATIDVPFAFTVGNNVCPAGHYTVRKDEMGGSVELVGASKGFKWIIHPGDPAPTDSRVILKFVDTGSSHALRSVQYGPMVTSRLDKTPRESEAAQNVITLGAAGQ